MAKKKLFKGEIGRAIVRGKDLDSVMQNVAAKWVQGVNDHQADYVNGLRDYLVYYMPKILDAYEEAIQMSGRTMEEYFRDTSLNTKAQVALKVWEATRKIAADWKKERVEEEIKKKREALEKLSKESGSRRGKFAGANKEEPVKKVVVSSVKI